MIDKLAPDPSKRLIVKLPVKDNIKPENSDLRDNNLDRLVTVASGLPAYTSSPLIGT